MLNLHSQLVKQTTMANYCDHLLNSYVHIYFKAYIHKLNVCHLATHSEAKLNNYLVSRIIMTLMTIYDHI